MPRLGLLSWAPEDMDHVSTLTCARPRIFLRFDIASAGADFLTAATPSACSSGPRIAKAGSHIITTAFAGTTIDQEDSDDKLDPLNKFTPDPRLETSIARDGHSLQDFQQSWPNEPPPLGPPKKPTTRPLPCLHGTLYGTPCPSTWKFQRGSDDGSLPDMCLPPKDYVWSDDCLFFTGDKTFISANLNKQDKREAELQCSVSWPCADDQVGGGGDKPDYTEVCPQGWDFLQTGQCRAPADYKGVCYTLPNFLAYTASMKATWAANCGVSWPLQPPPPKPKPLHQEDRDDPSMAVWASCPRNYTWDCPMDFKLDANGLCNAHANYANKDVSLCSRFDSYRWTEEMKKAFEKSCTVEWPCKGDLVIQSGMGLLAGLAFL